MFGRSKKDKNCHIYNNLKVGETTNTNHIMLQLSHNTDEDDKSVAIYVFTDMSQAEEFFRTTLDIVRFKMMSSEKSYSLLTDVNLKKLH